MKKKILIYGDSPVGGYRSYADTISEICKLIRDEYEIYIVALTGSGYLKNDNFTILPQIKELVNAQIGAPQNIEYYSNLINPDVILIHSDSNLFTYHKFDRNFMYKFVSTSKIPIIFYAVIDGLPIPERDLHLFNLINSNGGRVVTFSKFANAAYPTSSYIPHGVNVDYFKPSLNRKEWREELGVKDTDVVIGFVGGYNARKQPFRFLNLMLRLQKEYGDSVKGIFLSDPDELCSEYISDNKINLIDYPRESSHMVKVYAAFDIFVLPTAGEAFGKPLIEAAACGLPIVTTNCCTGPELTEGHGELVRVATTDYCMCCGTKRSLCDEDDLYIKTKKLIDDPSLREKYSKIGIEFAKSYQWNLFKDDWLTVLECRK